MADKLDEKALEYSSRLDAFELYHLIMQNADKPSQRNGGPVLPALGHAIAGAVATAVAKLAIYPLDMVITRLQVQKGLKSPKGQNNDSEYRGLVDAAIKIYHHEGGIGAFYTGCSTEVSKGIVDSFLFFLAYSFLQQRQLRGTSQKHLTVAQEMGIGIVAGAFTKLFTSPLQNIITRQQTAALAVERAAKSEDDVKKSDKISVADIARQIHKEKGMAGFWTGYSLNLILTLNPAITFGVDAFIQKVIRVRETTPIVRFLVAATSKATATAVTYPMSVAKSRAQAMTSQEDSSPKSGGQKSLMSRVTQLFAAQYAVLLSIRKIYEQDGASGLYSGIEAEVLKGFLSHGLTMMTKDRVHGGVIELYYTLLKFTSNWPAQIMAPAAAGGFISDAGERVENISVTSYEAGKSVAGELGTRAANFGGTVVEAAGGIAERADNIGTTIVEAGKSTIANSAESAGKAGTNVLSSGKAIAADGAERVENISVTTIDAGKSAGKEAAKSVSNLSGSAVKAGKNAAADVKNQAEYSGVALYGAGKLAAITAAEQMTNATAKAGEAGKQAVGDAKEGLNNVGATTIEAAKSVVQDVKK